MLQFRDTEALPFLPTNLIGLRNTEMNGRDRRTMCREIAFRILDAIKKAGGTMAIADLISHEGPVGLGRTSYEIAEGIDYGEEFCMYSRNVMHMTLTAEL